MPSAPSYLCKDRHGAFMFRRVLPHLLRPYFNMQREIRKSLHTYERAVALRRARVLAVKLDQLFDMVDDIDDLLFLKDEYQARINELAIEITLLQSTDRQPFEEIVATLLEHQKSSPSHAVDREIDKVADDMARYSSTMLKLFDEYKTLTLKLVALDDHITTQQKIAGQKLLRQEIVLPRLPTSHTPVTQPSHKPKLSEVIDGFIAYKRSGKTRFGTGAVEGYETAIADLIFVHGDLPVDAITFDQACQFRDLEQRIPKHRSKNAAYKSMSCAELAALNLPSNACISARTTSERLGALRGIYSWLLSSGHVDRNPFVNVSCEYHDNPTPHFTSTDLNEIFSSALYVDSPYSRSAFASAAHWWLPLLSLWSGARPSELVQMRLDDVRVIDGILAAEVLDDDETGQRSKTSAGRRIFPIHPMLLELGFEEYVAALRKAGAERVLNSIKMGSMKSGSEAGKWFNGRYRELHLPAHIKAESKVLYSFRCTYITEALNSGVDLRDLQQMAGHEKAQLKATKSYDRGQTTLALRDSINKIKFYNLDLTALADGCKTLKRL